MTCKIKRGITLFAVLLSVDVALSVVAISLTLAFLYTMNYVPMFVTLGFSAIFSYAVPFFLAALLWRFNAAKVISMSAELDTTDAEKIADGLAWRMKPTKRLVIKCIKRKYI